MSDLFRSIENYPGYRISRSGDVQSCWVRRGRYSQLSDAWRALKPIERNGYLHVSPVTMGEKKPRPIHRLVLEAFVGPCPVGCVACHYDGDRKNNCLDNLRWDTPKANSLDKYRHGTMIRGEAARHARLNEEEVLEIRRLRVEGMKVSELAARFDVGKDNIGAIIYRRSWRHILTTSERECVILNHAARGLAE